MSHKRDKLQARTETHRDRNNDDDRPRSASRRHRSRSRSPVSGRSSHQRPYHRDRKKSPSPPTRGFHKSHPKSDLSVSNSKKIYQSQESGKNNIGEGLDDSLLKQSMPESSSFSLKEKPSKFQPELVADSLSKDNKNRLEEAIAAAKELAAKQPPSMSARPMTEQQKVIQEKRKLLWSGKKSKPAQSRNQWESVSFGKDGEDNKFRRLMGIGASKSATADPPKEEQNEGSVQESERALTALEQQYEASRYLTHVARGAGLGYGSQALTTELPSQKNSGDKLHETL